MSNDLVCKKEIKCNKIKNNTKMINCEYIAIENIKEHNPNWSQILDHPYSIINIYILCKW